MKRVIIVPVAEIRQFPGMKILARGDRLLRSWAIPLKREPEAPSIRRTRFSIRLLYTFNTLAEAARFAKGKIEALTAIERSIDTNRADATGSLKIGPIAVPNSTRRRKRA